MIRSIHLNLADGNVVVTLHNPPHHTSIVLSDGRNGLPKFSDLLKDHEGAAEDIADRLADLLGPRHELTPLLQRKA